MSVPGAADTVIVTASLDTPESVAVTVAAFDVPLSSIVADDNASVTVGNASSSVSVNVTLDGAATPLPPEAVPETVTDLFGESTEFPFALTVTTPVLVVSPDAIVNSVALDNEKSPATAPAPAAASTVTVTASLEAPESVAETVDTPPLSDTDVDDSPSATVGNASSSLSVNVTSEGAATPLPPETVPETVTDLSGESTEFPCAVIVTLPVLVVSPAAIVSFVRLDSSVKSSATAPAPAAAATVTVTASLDAPESVAVTAETPLLSPIDVGDSPSVTVGNASSSSSVNVTFDGAATPLAPETVPETVTVSSASCVVSSTPVTVTVPVLVVTPAAIVNVSALDNVKSPAAAVAPVAPTVTVTASLDTPESVAVTVAAPPSSRTDIDDSASAATGSASSSSIVNVTLDGAATPLAPETAAETVTDLSGEFVVSSVAVTVTVPALVVEPAAIVNVFAFDRLKSPVAVFAPAAAATVSVTASLDAWDSVAVTVLVPGFVPSCSSIAAGLNASVAVGVVSSSSSVSATPVTLPTPWLFRALPVTVTPRLPTLSTASSTGVTLTESEPFAVSPAAMTMVASEPTV